MEKDKKKVNVNQCEVEDKKDHNKPDTATDVYYKTECKLSDSKVAIPTEDSVLEAKEWADDENKK